jgi:glucose-6-phosphate isomerase
MPADSTHEAPDMTQLHSSLPAWQAVDAHAREMSGTHLRDLDATDPLRWQNLHLEHDDWLLDFSRQRVTGKTLALLIELARAVNLEARVAAMFRGDAINTTERRAVLHTALRSDFAGSAAIQAEVKDSRQKLADFVGAVRRGSAARISARCSWPTPCGRSGAAM